MESFSKVCIGEKKITLHMFLLKRSHTLYVVYVVMESFSKVCIGEKKDYTTHVSFEAVTYAICCICCHGKFFQGLYR